MSCLVGGVGELYQGDLDLGRLAAERLAAEDLGADVLVEDLYYGAIAVAQRLEELRPAALVLVGTSIRGQPAGHVQRRRLRPTIPSVEDHRRALEEAGTGYVSIDLVFEVASGLGVLPDRTVSIEVEPETSEPGAPLSPPARDGLEQALFLVRAELLRMPLLELADEMRGMLAGDRLEPTLALDAMRQLLGAVEILDEEGRWGSVFTLRDQLRLRIAAGETGDGMDHLDWSLWWALIEELDRLQSSELDSLA